MNQAASHLAIRSEELYKMRDLEAEGGRKKQRADYIMVSKLQLTLDNAGARDINPPKSQK